MQRYLIATVLAAALVAAAPASAQRASLADRVAALEQQAANNQGNVDLLNQVTQLKTEVQTLRSQIEELQQQQEQAKQSGRNQYLDIDGRLNRLEGGARAEVHFLAAGRQHGRGAGAANADAGTGSSGRSSGRDGSCRHDGRCSGSCTGSDACRARRPCACSSGSWARSRGARPASTPSRFNRSAR